MKSNKLFESIVSVVSPANVVTEAKEEGTTPKTEKEKELAAKEPPYDKITQADVLAARGVIKEGTTVRWFDVDANLAEEIGVDLTHFVTDGDRIGIVEGAESWAQNYSRMRAAFGAPEVEKVGTDTHYVIEGLTDDAKQAIQKVLGPKSYATDPHFYLTGERKENPLRANSLTARTLIKLAKTKPENVKYSPDYGHIAYHPELGGVFGHADNPDDALAMGHMNVAAYLATREPGFNDLSPAEKQDKWQAIASGLKTRPADRTQYTIVQHLMGRQEGLSESLNVEKEERARGHIIAVRNTRGETCCEIHPHVASQLAALKPGDSLSYDGGDATRVGDVLQIKPAAGGKFNVPHDEFASKVES